MTQVWSSRVCLAGFVGLGFCWLTAEAALAQITPDNTLGGESSTVMRGVTVRGSGSDRIEGGATRGINLFHSFQEFSVLNGQRVYFANPTNIENIFSRVTGNSASSILGTLGVDGNANLFLMNPNGVVFGPSARLDVNGSFFATTANRFTFSDGSSFGTTNSQELPLLTMNVPVGIQYGNTAGDITNRGHLQTGRDLTLAATNLDLQGQLLAGRHLTLRAQDTLRIRDSATSPFVAAANGRLLAQGNETVDIFALSHPDSGLFSGEDMVLRSPTSVIGDAHYTSNGSFRIEQPDGSLGALTSPNDPVIRARGDVEFDSYGGASLHIFAGGSVRIPSFVWITGTDPVNGIVQDVSLVGSPTTIPIRGNTIPTLDIRAGIRADSPDLATPGIVNSGNGVFLPPDPNPNAAPTGADIEVGTIYFATADLQPQAGVILLTNQYQPNDELSGTISMSSNPDFTNFLSNRAILNAEDNPGDGFINGRIEVHSRGDITLEGVVNTNPASFDGGFTIARNGGDVVFRAGRNIIFERGALINSLGVLGGNVTLAAEGMVQMSGPPLPGELVSGVISLSSLSSAFDAPDDARAGNVNISANRLELLDGALIATSTLFFPPSEIGANPGDVNIQADTIWLDNGSQIRSNIESGGVGNAGTIRIEGRSLLLTGGSQIQSLLFRPQLRGDGTVIPGGQGRGGRIRLELSDSITISGFNEIGGFSSGIFTSADRETVGSPGRIRIITGLLDVSNGGLIGASVFNNTPRDAEVLNDIVIDANIVRLRDGGQIFVNTRGDAAAGNVVLRVSDRLIIRGVEQGAAERLARLQAYIDGLGTGDTIEDLTSGLGTASGIFASTGPYRALGGPVVTSDRTGNAGNIVVTARSVRLRDNGVIDATTRSLGQGGIVLVRATDDIRLIGSDDCNLDFCTRISSDTYTSDGDPSAGFILLRANTLDLSNQAQIRSSTAGAGNAGAIWLDIAEMAIFDNASAFSSTVNLENLPRSTGSSGNILVGNIVLNENRIPAILENIQNIRVVRVDPSNALIFTNGSSLNANTNGDGNAGGIYAIANTINLFDLSQFRVTTEKNAGVFDSTSSQGGFILLGGGLSFQPDGAFLEILPAQTINLRNGGSLLANTFGRNAPGNIYAIANTINLSDFSELRVTVESGAGPEFTDGRATNGFTTVGFIALGGGMLFNSNDSFQAITPADSINLSDGASLTANTQGNGDASSIFAVANRFSLNNGQIRIAVDEGGTGDGSDLVLGGGILFTGDGRFQSLLAAGSIILDNGFQLIASTSGRGSAGDIIAAANSITFSNGNSQGFSSAAFTSVERTNGEFAADRQGGDIILGGSMTFLPTSDASFLQTLEAAQTITLSNGGQMIASTSGQGRAGNVMVAGDRIQIEGSFGSYPSAIFNGVNENAVSASGQANQQVLGGDVIIGGRMTFTPIDASRPLVESLMPADRIVLDGGLINVSSFAFDLNSLGLGAVLGERRSTGQVAGNIAIATRALGLLNASGIVAQTSAGDGGNIFINADITNAQSGGRVNFEPTEIESVVVMAGGSLISTTAGTNALPGAGGNITLNPAGSNEGFLVGEQFGNNDILSNAYNSSGGVITLNARGIFGFVQRSREDLQRIFSVSNPPPLSPYTEPLGPLQTNDITAFSQTAPNLSGTITLNANAADPTGGLAELPNLRDTPQVSAQCPTTAEAAQNLSEFYSTGRGGLPPSPADAPSGEGVVTQLATVAEGTGEELEVMGEGSDRPIAETSAPIVEAQTWTIGPDGKVHLVTEGTGAAPARISLTAPGCRG